MEENKVFTTFDTFSVLALVTGTILILASIVSSAFSDQKSQEASRRAHQLATQIISGGFKNLLHEDSLPSSDSKRMIASQLSAKIPEEGRIGMDPWGRPYYYRVVDFKGGHKAFVLSSGSNGVRDSIDDENSSDSSGRASSIIKRGDDILEVISSS